MNRVSVTDGKKNFNALVSSESTSIVTRNGKPTAAVVPYDEYKRMIRYIREQDDLKAIEKANLFFEGQADVVSQDEVTKMLNEGKL